MEYAELLKRAKENMPAGVHERDRFEIPKVMGHVERHKTVINNFVVIANYLHRPVEHVLKFTLRELATSGEILKSGLLALKTKIPASRINEKIKEYAHEFVLCPRCGKPDSDLKSEGAFMFLVCQACGEKTQVKSKI